MTDDKEETIRPFNNLKKMANAIAKTHAGIGAIIIVAKEDGTISIGTDGIPHFALREMLNIAIHYSFVNEKKAANQ